MFLNEGLGLKDNACTSAAIVVAFLVNGVFFSTNFHIN